jgi:hypothetical protein
MFVYSDSVITATRARNKTIVPAVLSLLAIFDRKYVKKAECVERPKSPNTFQNYVFIGANTVSVFLQVGI